MRRAFSLAGGRAERAPGRHFASGGDFVFLDAADDAAARVYERLGFKRFGANLVYR